MNKINKKIVSCLIVVVLIFIAISCDPMDYKLKIINTTNFDICYEISQDSFLNINKLYTRETWNQYCRISKLDSILKGYPVSDSWEYINSESKNGKLNLFIFKYDTLIKYDWKTIVDEKKYYSFICLSKRELDSIEWRIIIK
jgi:hypothetical protein